MSAVKFIIPLTVLVSTFMLASCGWDPYGIEAQKKWIAQQDEAHRQYEDKIKEENDERTRRVETEKREYLASHPEVHIEKLPLDAKTASANALRKAINDMEFVTRDPSTNDLNQIYVNVGRAKFTMSTLNRSFSAQNEECKRVSAYTGENLNDFCKFQLAKGIQDYARILKNQKINGMTKQYALYSASYGDYIDYEHAARLAVMHYRICEQQGNQGYVEMVTSAVPCNGAGDVLNSYTARKLGLISN